MKTLLLGMLGLAAACGAPPAAAQVSAGVTAARAAGAVGERFDGYLGYRVTPSAGVRSQTDAVNIRRRALYTGLAGRRGVTTQDVGVAAACQLLATVAVGESYLLGDGVWRRRGAGEAAPVPDYCA